MSIVLIKVKKLTKLYNLQDNVLLPDLMLGYITKEF